MPLIGPRRMDALAPRPPRRRSRRIRRAVLISLLIHVGIGVLLLVNIRREEKPELLPPPSAVTMLFDTGRKSGPTLPNPNLQATPSTPPGQASRPPQKAPLPVPPVPPPPAPPSSAAPLLSAPSPPPAAPPAPLPAAPAIPTPAPTAPPAQGPPPPPLPESAPIPPPPSAAEPAPIPPAAPPPAARPSPAPKPPPARLPPRQATPQQPPDFPAPTNFSFGKPQLALNSPARRHSAPHIPGTIDMLLGPASRGTADDTPLSDRDQDAEGADWRNALSRWVAEHAYYPMEARRDGEEGDSKVRVVADPNGHVKLVELIGKSGSMWLDLALLALFRDQNIPALPYGTKDPIDFNFTMHYILIRPR